MHPNDNLVVPSNFFLATTVKGKALMLRVYALFSKFICLALAEHGRCSRADLIRCVSEGGCGSENVGKYLAQKRREKRGMFDLDDENFVLTKEGAQLAVNLGVEPTYVQGRRGGP